MPLNIDDPDRISEQENSETGPDLHEPPKSAARKLPTPVIIAVLSLLIVAAGAYLVWQLDLLGLNSARPELSPQAGANENANPPAVVPADTSSTTHQDVTLQPEQPQHDVGKTGPAVESRAPAVEKSVPPQAQHTGTYTIYISRHRSKETADEEASRWKEAGYETFVSTDEGWYRVSIGRYATWDEAKDAAEGLKDAFESGYRIGRVAE